MYHQRSIIGPGRLCSLSQCFGCVKEKKIKSVGLYCCVCIFFQLASYKRRRTSTRNTRSLQEDILFASCDQGSLELRDISVDWQSVDPCPLIRASVPHPDHIKNTWQIQTTHSTSVSWLYEPDAGVMVE